MKLSEMPEGTVIEIEYEEGEKVQFELTSNKENPEWDTNYISRDSSDQLQNFKIISVPYALALKLAEMVSELTHLKDISPEFIIEHASRNLKKEKPNGAH